MGTKMTNAPVYFTLAQVRHNPVLSLTLFQIQESLRKAGYPDFQRPWLSYHLGSVSSAAATPNRSNLLRFERFIFKHGARGSSWIRITVISVDDYDTFESFLAHSSWVGNCSLPLVFFSERVGIRYLMQWYQRAGERPAKISCP